MHINKNNTLKVFQETQFCVVSSQEIEAGFYIKVAETFSHNVQALHIISLYLKSTLRIETYHCLCKLTDLLVSLV